MPPPEPMRRPAGSATAIVLVWAGRLRFSSSMRALVACNSLAAVTTTKTCVVGGGVSALSSRSAAITRQSGGSWVKRLRRLQGKLRVCAAARERLHEMRCGARAIN